MGLWVPLLNLVVRYNGFVGSLNKSSLLIFVIKNNCLASTHTKKTASLKPPRRQGLDILLNFFPVTIFYCNKTKNPQQRYY